MKKKKDPVALLSKEELQKQLKKKNSALVQLKREIKINSTVYERESQIEAALEKVRTRSLAMHHSDELNEIVKVLFDQLQHMDLLLAGNRTITIVTFNDDKKEMNFRITGEKFPNVVTTFVRYTEHSIVSDIWKAKEKGLDYFSKVYSFEEKNKYLAWAFEFTNNKDLPEDLKRWFLEKNLMRDRLLLQNTRAYTSPTMTGLYF